MDNENVDDNKKYYFGEISPGETTEIINKVTKQEDKTILIWTQRERRALAEEYDIISFDVTTSKLYFKAKGKLLASFKKSKKVDSEIFFRVTLGRFYFFSTSFLQYDSESKEYSLEVKNTLYKGQQRGDFRIKQGEWVKLTINIDKKEYPCVDLSSGGLCFVVPKAMEESFQKDRTFFNCTVTFNDKEYLINRANIASAWQDKEDSSKLFVGVCFIDLLGQTEEDLFKQINVTSKEIEERNRRLAERYKKKS